MEAADRERINLYMAIPMIASQDILILATSPVYVFFEKRKEAAQKYLEYDREYLKYDSSQVISQELMVDIIQMCNDSIKKYLGLI